MEQDRGNIGRVTLYGTAEVLGGRLILADVGYLRVEDVSTLQIKQRIRGDVSGGLEAEPAQRRRSIEFVLSPDSPILGAQAQIFRQRWHRCFYADGIQVDIDKGVDKGRDLRGYRKERLVSAVVQHASSRLLVHKCK